MSPPLRILILCLSLSLAACAPKAVILDPGAVPAAMDQAKAEGPAAWSMWVTDARDARPPERAGQRVGTLYTRFKNNPQSAFLKMPPEQYVREQLSRYLLHRGLEASGRDTAKVLLSVDLENFSLVEKPGAMWDELTVQVGYTVHFSDPTGRDLGRVKVESGAEVKSPLDSIKEAEKAFRGALSDTFQALTRSEAFQAVVKNLGG